MKLTIHHKVSVSLSPYLERWLMSVFDDVMGKLDTIATAVTTEADQIKAKLEQIKAEGSLTADQAAQIDAKVQAINTAIDALSEVDSTPAPSPGPDETPTV